MKGMSIPVARSKAGRIAPPTPRAARAAINHAGIAPPNVARAVTVVGTIAVVLIPRVRPANGRFAAISALIIPLGVALYG